MTTKRMHRSFSKREKVMLLILAVCVVVAAYYLLVIKNVADTEAANATKLETIESDRVIQQALSVSYTAMQAELDALGPTETLPLVAQYDNVSNVVKELNGILAQTASYAVDFEQPKLTGETVRRPVKLTFTASDYEQAVAVISSLQNGKYRCDVTDFVLRGNMLANGGVESVSATLKITYYETTRGASSLGGLTEVEQ